MRKIITALAAAGLVAAASITTPEPAQARCIGCAVGVGVAGGLLAGALIAGAARPAPYYGYGGYGPAPVYYGGAYGPPCYWRTQRFWDGWGWSFRRVRVCY